jgi:hypothetical protein
LKITHRFGGRGEKVKDSVVGSVAVVAKEGVHVIADVVGIGIVVVDVTAIV